MNERPCSLPWRGYWTSHISFLHIVFGYVWAQQAKTERNLYIYPSLLYTLFSTGKEELEYAMFLNRVIVFFGMVVTCLCANEVELSHVSISFCLYGFCSSWSETEDQDQWWAGPRKLASMTGVADDHSRTHRHQEVDVAARARTIIDYSLAIIVHRWDIAGVGSVCAMCSAPAPSGTSVRWNSRIFAPFSGHSRRVCARNTPIDRMMLISSNASAVSEFSPASCCAPWKMEPAAPPPAPPTALPISPTG